MLLDTQRQCIAGDRYQRRKGEARDRCDITQRAIGRVFGSCILVSCVDQHHQHRRCRQQQRRRVARRPEHLETRVGQAREKAEHEQQTERQQHGEQDQDQCAHAAHDA